MQAMALTAEQREAAPEVARRLLAILTSLAALVAHAFLRDPFRVGLIVPLWTRITRAARRFQRLMDRVARGRERPRPPRVRSVPPVACPPRPAMPSAGAWLAVALRHRGAGHASQLRHLLSDPQAAAIIAATPQAARLLRPLCHMLGITHPAIAKPPRQRISGPVASAELECDADRRGDRSRSDGKGPDGAAIPICPATPEPSPRPEAAPDLLWPWLPWQPAS